MVTDPQGKMVVLTDDWVDENMEPTFIDDLKTRWDSSGRFVTVPVGCAKDKEVVIPDSLLLQDAPEIYFHQGTRNTCVADSIASAFMYRSNPCYAKMIHDVGVSIVDFKQEGCNNLLNLVRETIASFGPKYQPKKIPKTIELSSLVKESPNLRLVVLKSSDGQSNHAVTLIDKWIFDSTLAVAIPLSIEGLHFCCGSGCECIGIAKGYDFGGSTSASLLRRTKPPKKRKRPSKF